MSKPSTATAPKNPLPAKSAWSRGPPLSATTPSPRSQSPAPSTPVTQTHSRRSSTLGQAGPVKDGVGVSRPNMGPPKQKVTFGSIDDNPTVTTSASQLPAPVAKSSETVVSFGSLPATAPTTSSSGHVNGKSSISSRPSVLPMPMSTSSTSVSSVSTSASSSAQISVTATNSTRSTTPLSDASSVRKFDIKSLFQNPSTSSTADATSSPSTRNPSLPTQPPSSHQGPSSSSSSSHPPPSQPGAHSYPYMRQNQQHAGSNGTPRSPSFQRAMPNGSVPRTQGGQGAGGPSAAVSSPRLNNPPHPHNPHNGQPSTMPPPTPQMQSHLQSQMPTMAWPPYYYDQPYVYQWYHHMPMQAQPQPPLQGPHMVPHTGMPMSPRNPPSNLQNPATPTLSHTHPNPVHPPIPAPTLAHPSNSIGGLPSATPSAPTTIPPSKSLNTSATAFVPRKPVTVKNPEGVEMNLAGQVAANASVPPSPAGLRHGSPGTSSKRPTSVRIESEDQRKQRLAEEKEKERQAEEKVRKEKELAERKAKEEEDKKKREEEEKERLRQEAEEKERRRKEEEERLKEAEKREAQRIKEEEESKRREEEEARRNAEAKARKEEEERLQREKEAKEKAERQRERERLERERAEKEKAEQEQLAKEAEAERLRLEQKEAERKAATEAQVDARPEKEDGEIDEDGDTSPAATQDGKDKVKENLRISTNFKRHPGNLDLTDAKKTNIPAPQSALATARVISDINAVTYPEGVSSPNPALNQNAKEGKFRYDRDFLLQFMSICKEKPASLPPLDAIGLEPLDSSSLHIARGGSGRHRTPSAALPPARQASIGLGLSSSSLSKGASSSFHPMGNFATAGASKLSSEDRFAASSRAVSVGGAGMPFPRPMGLTRTASTGGPGGPTRERTRSKRGEKRNESNKVGNTSQSQVMPMHNQHAVGFEPVAPLQVTANRWDRKAFQADADSSEVVDRKVKGLLNKLTMEKFDSISDQIIEWANKSENEKDGRTLIQVIKLVFEKATDEATWSEMYARLCRKMMEQISPKVQDDGIKNNEGKPIAGGQLFRKYLLNRCQEDFERGWVAKEAAAAAAATKAMEDQAVKAANENKGDEKEVALYSDEYYVAQKAKRRGLGLIKFIGELFKLQMLTERIMHECVKKLLGNVDNPEEEEIESLCKLLTTVGLILDTQKARAHMDVYFSRMKELTKSLHVTSRMQFMLQDILELRERKWIARQSQSAAAPTTLAQVHEAAAKEKAAQEKEAYQRQMSMSRGGSRRGGDRNDHPQVGPDGWTVTGSNAPRPQPKVGDLSNFGKISKGQPMTFGPSSVFAGKKTETKKESISRTASSSNMFSMLSSQTAENGDAAPKPTESQRKRIILQPRSKPVEAEPAETASPTAESDNSVEQPASPAHEMSEDSAMKKIAEDVKEFFNVRNTQEDAYFTELPHKYRSRLVEKLVGHVVEAKEAEARLLSDFFAYATSKEICSSESFEEGFIAIAEIIDDVIYDAPKALDLFAIVIKGAALDESRSSNIASKSLGNSDKLLGLLH